MWWKKHKWKILVPAAAVLLLAVAFWLGGPAEPKTAAPKQPALSSAAPAQASASAGQGKTAAVSSSPKAAKSTAKPASPSPAPTASPSPAPTVSPTPEAAPTPEPDESAAPSAPDDGPDRYQTDPVPEGRPEPVEPEDVDITEESHTCTLSISCKTILDNMAQLDPAKTALVPEDGWILQPTTVTFYQGESVFNVLQRTCKQQGIHMEFENTPMYHSAYIEGIQNLYQFDCGDLSGWMYKVNDWFPNYGCSRYQLREGDVICWEYTCDLGADLGRSVD